MGILKVVPIVGVILGLSACGGGGSTGASGNTASNGPPVANAGSNQTVAAGSAVILDGSGSSDPNGDSLTYSWSFTSQPAGSITALSDASSVKATFVPDMAGAYVVGLRVSDGKNGTADSSITITASPATDVASPQLKNFSISPTVINTATQAQTVTLSMKLSDNMSGVASANVAFMSPTVTSLILCLPKKASGTVLDGIYSCDLTLPQGSAQGSWNFGYLTVKDGAANQVTYLKADVTALGFPTTFVNSGP